MEPNAAPAASPAVADAGTETPTVDSYGFPIAGDLSTDDMSDAELEAFVDQSLGIKPKGATNESNTTPPAATPANPANVAPVTTPTPDVPAATTPPAVTPQPEAKPTPELAPEAPVEIPTLDTSDLWIDILNADGEKVRLSLDEGVPEDIQFTSDKQLYEVMDAFNEMRQLKANREAKITEATTAKEKQETAQQSEQATIVSWGNEIQDLIDAGLIPKSEKQPADGKTYTQAEIDAEPGLKLTNDVFDYMKAQNAKRTADGKGLITSFAAAFTLFKNDADRLAQVEADKQANDLKKKRGAIVGGGSSPSGSDKGYTYKRGSARNVWQVDTSDI